MENLFTPNKIRLYSGNYFDPFNPDPELILIEDIAHGLSMKCRFGGHTKRFYSSAEHSVNVGMLCAPPHAFAGLMHDASDGYLPDVPTPLKKRMPEFIEAEHNLMKIIAKKFDFEWPLHPEVKQCDFITLKHEWETAVLHTDHFALLPEDAEKTFMEFFCMMGNVSKVKTIIVNSKPINWESNIISYDQLLGIAFPALHRSNNPVIDILFYRGYDVNREGSLKIGGHLKIKEGMIFNVSVTNNA